MPEGFDIMLGNGSDELIRCWPWPATCLTPGKRRPILAPVPAL
jgi:hypothetical protein